jgi:uncharacterized membrane protein YkvI
MLMGMGLLGWLVALVLGFVVGGIMFMSIKAQVDYVVRQRGPEWLMPAALYARMAFLAVVLVLVAVFIPSEKLAGAVLGGLVGALVARVLVSRMVRRRPPEEIADGGE